MQILLQIVNVAVIVLTLIIFARVIVSWIAIGGSSSGNSPFVAFVYKISEPILAPIRRILPRTGTIDLSPMVALLILWAIWKLVQWAA